MDFLKTLTENDFEKIRLILCPVCYKTVPTIFTFIEPKTNTPFIAIKCPNQENVATLPIRNFLTEYLLYDFENNSLIIQDESILDKYNISENNCIKPEELQSLIHFKNNIPQKDINRCVVCDTQDQGQNISSYCAQCMQWFCNDCLIIHSKLAKDHLLSIYGFDIKDKCWNSLNQENNDHLNIKQCNNCRIIMCQQCEKGNLCSKCSVGRSEEFNLIKKTIKQKCKWNEILNFYLRKMQLDEEYKTNFIKYLNEKHGNCNQIEKEIETIYNQHKQNIDEVFCLLKVLYANFQKSKEYHNFNILLNFENNLKFNRTLFTPDTNALNNLGLYQEELINYYKNNSLLMNKYNNFFYKTETIDVTIILRNFCKITAMFYVKCYSLLLVALSEYIISFNLDKEKLTFKKNNRLSMELKNISICKMVSANESETNIIFITNNDLLGFLFLESNNSLNVGIYKPNIAISEIQESIFHKELFIMVKEMEFAKFAKISKKNVVETKKHIEKKITHLCEVSDKYVVYTNGFKLYIEKIFSERIFEKNDPKVIEIPNNQQSKIISMTMIHKTNKLLILIPKNGDNYLKMECIVINNIDSKKQMSCVEMKITNVPFEIFSIIQVNNFMFGKISVQGINKGNISPCLVNIYIQNTTNCVKYSYVNIEGNNVIQLDDNFYLIQNDNSFSLFENISKEDNTKNKNVYPIPIALYNIKSK